MLNSEPKGVFFLLVLKGQAVSLSHANGDLTFHGIRVFSSSRDFFFEIFQIRPLSPKYSDNYCQSQNFNSGLLT